MKINSAQAKDYILRCIRAGITPMLSGSPGIGKSDLIKQIAKEYNLELIDIRLSTMDPTTLTGFPMVKDGIASFVPMDIFPLENTALPNGKNGWIIFLDELPSAPLAVQAAAYRLILDKEVGKHRLHPKVAVIGAGNLSTDGAIVNRMGTAMQSRLVHLELDVTIKEWLVWANQNDIDHRIMAYVNHVPDNLHKFDPRHNDKTFACPRTYHFCSELIKGIPTPDLQEIMPLLAGTISQGIAMEFIGYTEIYSAINTYAEIVRNPATVHIGTEPAMLFATAHMVAAHTTKKDIDKTIQFIERLPIEFQVITLQGTIAKNPGIITEPCLNKWIAEKGAELF